MSDSEQEQTIQIEEVPEFNQPHIKQILTKGKHIAPFYQEADLFKLYKSYYSVDYLFYQQLEIIAKRRNNQDSNDGAWISVGRTQANVVANHDYHPKKASHRSNKPRYNFLEDKELIARALNFEKQLQVDRQFRQKSRTQYKEKFEHKNGNHRQEFKQSNKYQQKKEQKNEKQQKEQKLKYKPKQEENQQKQAQKEAQKELPVSKNQTNSKNKESSTSKVSTSVVEKPKQNNVQTNAAQKTEKQQFKEKQTSQIKASTQNKFSAENKTQKTKYQQKPGSVAPVPDKPTTTSKPNSLPQQKVVTTTQNTQPVKQGQSSVESKSNEKVISKAVTNETKTVTNEAKTVKIAGQQHIDYAQSERIYAEACQASPLLLGFVKPKGVVQRISYIRYPDGKFSKISIRETRSSKMLG